MDQRFLFAVEKTLGHEGGYSCDPLDPGGESRFGISKKSYPRLNIGTLTKDRAIEIYRRDFWEPNRYAEIEEDSIAEKVFDLAVNMGARGANTLLQVAVLMSGGGRLKLDGVVGPKTLGAVNGHANPKYLLAEIKLRACKYYVGLGNRNYLAGWIRRALS